MTSEQLRNSLLQEAISGRLVPQDPKDEPASVLLSRISEEKDLFLKKKRSKQIKSLPPVNTNELSFEIPSNWTLCRLQDILRVSSGKSIKVRTLKDDLPYPVYGGNGVNGTSDQYNVESDTLIIGRVGFYCGAIHKTNSKAWVTDNALIVTLTNNCVFVDYLKHVLTWMDIGKTSNSTAQPVVSGKGIYPLVFPLPPLAEQKRIVSKLEELLPIVEEYGKAQKELEDLNLNLPTRLRQSVLQEAISGKLVLPIRVNEVVKTTVAEDEFPFEIPQTWGWSYLGEHVKLISGTSYQKGDVKKSGIRILRGGNIVNESLKLFEDDVFLPQSYASKEKNVRKNDIIIVASTGSKKVIGKPALIREDLSDTQIGAFLRIVRPLDEKMTPYLWVIFSSEYYRGRIRDLVKGTNINNIKEEYISKMPIPVPPFEEQKLIVEKLEQILPQIDKLANL